MPLETTAAAVALYVAICAVNTVKAFLSMLSVRC
jgi:hypothetical protein